MPATQCSFPLSRPRLLKTLLCVADGLLLLGAAAFAALWHATPDPINRVLS